MSAAAPITYAGRRRASTLARITTLVDGRLEQSKVVRGEALEMLVAITRRVEKNHIAAGIAAAFEERRV